MSLGLAFLTAFMATALVGVVAKFGITYLFAHPSARIAAFCLALGFALGRYSYAGPLNQEALYAACAALGSLIALVVLWLWLLKLSPAPKS
jgi:hypothetical protein